MRHGPLQKSSVELLVNQSIAGKLQLQRFLGGLALVR